MIYIIRVSFLLLIGIFLVDCDDNIVEPIDGLVVQAYLFANEPITEIKLSNLAELGSNTAGQAINDAFVVLRSERRDRNIQLEQTIGRPGYYNVPMSDFRPLAFEEFTLFIVYNSDTLLATTKVPLSPFGIEMNKKQLMLDTSSTSNTNDSIVVQWSSGGLYSPVIFPISPDQELIYEQNGTLDFLQEPKRIRNFVIGGDEVEYFGTNTFTLYRVNEEYARLFEVNSSNFFLDNGNIQNGHGIFTSFNSESFEFEVVNK